MDGDFAQLEVDEGPGFLGHIKVEAIADVAMPGSRVVLPVEFFLDEGGNFFLVSDGEVVKCLVRDVDGVLLHVLIHVSVLHNGFSFLIHGVVSVWCVY